MNKEKKSPKIVCAFDMLIANCAVGTLPVGWPSLNFRLFQGPWPFSRRYPSKTTGVILVNNELLPVALMLFLSLEGKLEKNCHLLVCFLKN